jgi:hypothetical protein
VSRDMNQADLFWLGLNMRGSCSHTGLR